jgi:hypothetical protein
MNDREVIIVRTYEEIQAIRETWEQMQREESAATINTDYDRYLSVLKMAGDRVQPYIILIKQKGHTKTMVVAVTETRQIACRIGYLTILKPKMRCLSVVYGGIIGQKDNEACSFLVNELMRILRSREIDMAFLNHTRTDSQIYELGRKMPGLLCRDYFPVVDSHWQTTALDGKEDFYKTLSRNERRNISRHTKSLEKKASGRVELKIFRGLQELEEYISTASEISSVTYQKIITGGFTNSDSVRSLLTQAAKMDWLRAYVLYAGSEPIAFESGLLYKSTYFAEYRGFNPDWSIGSPGSILLLKVLDEFNKDPDVKIYDYGFGDAPYKQRYGQQYWLEAPVFIFAPRPYPILVNVLRTLITAFSASLKFVLKKFGFIDRVKRRWRKHLERKASEKKKQ